LVGHCWRGDMAFKNTFPDLFGIACAKDAFVAVHVELCEGSIQCNVSFSRVAHD
jgi:hypothetical protein